MSGVTYDAGAFIAAERNDRSIWADHKALLEDGVDIVVPAGVVAQVWRGGARQAGVARLLGGCVIDPLDEPRARAVGALVGASGTSDIVDAHVAEVAVRLGHFAIYTSDRKDIEKVLAATGDAPQIRDV